MHKILYDNIVVVVKILGSIIDDIENPLPNLTRSYLSLNFTMWDGSFSFAKSDIGYAPALGNPVIADIRLKSTEYGLSNQRNPP